MPFILLILGLVSSLFSQAPGLFFPTNSNQELSSYEALLIDHAKQSIERAIVHKSKLKTMNFSETLIPYYHLLNNICSMPYLSFLFIGLQNGDAFTYSLLTNEGSLHKKIAVFAPGNSSFNSMLTKHISPHQFQVFINKYHKIDPSFLEMPVDIFVYDPDQSLSPIKNTLLYYEPFFADVFILVIDDWSWNKIRSGAFEAFSCLEWSILYQNIIPQGPILGNGQYVAVIKRFT